MARGDKKKENAERVPENEEEKRAKNRERVAKGQPENETGRTRWDAGGRGGRADTSIDKETNKRFMDGKSWREIAEEARKKGGKGAGGEASEKEKFRDSQFGIGVASDTTSPQPSDFNQDVGPHGTAPFRPGRGGGQRGRG